MADSVTNPFYGWEIVPIRRDSQLCPVSLKRVDKLRPEPPLNLERWGLLVILVKTVSRVRWGKSLMGGDKWKNWRKRERMGGREGQAAGAGNSL